MPTGTATVNLRFAGQYFDDESDLHYNWNRYYDPETGHYISSDPIGLNGGLNTFAYVGANPVMFVDPEGLHKGDQWYGYNDKQFHKWFHKCFKSSGDADADKETIEEAYAEWIKIGSPKDGQCGGTMPVSEEPEPQPSGVCNGDENCETTTKVVATTVVVGGVAYVVYKVIKICIGTAVAGPVGGVLAGVTP